MIKRNEYAVFIDESGSINTKEKGIFEIAFLIIAKNKVKTLKNYYRKKFLTFKRKNNISIKKELKAHFLKKNKYSEFIDYIFTDFLTTSKIVSGYVDNKKVTLKQNANKNFFHMIQLIIERAKDWKFLQDGDILWIEADQRINLKLEQERLKRVAKTKHNIKIKKFSFLDSRKEIMINIADIISNKCFNIILNSLKNKIKTPSIKNLSIREIYYW